MITYFLLLNLVLAALTLWACFEVKRFLKNHNTIDGSIAMEAFKTLARRNMIDALVCLALGIASILFAVYLVAQLQLIGLVIALAVYMPSYLLNRQLQVFERQARSLECASYELKELHAQIGQRWVKKALPDF
jgi:hypothetical protein